MNDSWRPPRSHVDFYQEENPNLRILSFKESVGHPWPIVRVQVEIFGLCGGLGESRYSFQLP